MPTKKILFIGHSHVRAIEAAAQRSEFADSTHFIVLNTEPYRSTARMIGGQIVLNEVLVAHIAEFPLRQDSCPFA